MPVSEVRLFLQTWLQRPKLVGAIAPSSQQLGRLMVAGVPISRGPVIELGPGTGTFTREILARGVAPESLVLVEADTGFASALREKFPDVRVLCMDASLLGNSGALFGRQRASAVVSGLPLLAMPPEKAVSIVKGVFDRHLHRDSAFYQFTYLPRSPISNANLEAIGLRSTFVGHAWANLPPAFVYRITSVEARRATLAAPDP